ncbi:hypothetical protein AOQ84DRAFT_357852 [Glonium stellatum]|uniref:Uncharacterized protein n=1 Tax=Glonium stellatum TaxID=574774 RepID=A0A8E2JLU7_9PEZI|nr:hypothetical protein AOQ84DRAFT_357852 [Glonium stellatum]
MAPGEPLRDSKTLLLLLAFYCFAGPDSRLGCLVPAASGATTLASRGTRSLAAKLRTKRPLPPTTLRDQVTRWRRLLNMLPLNLL